MQVTVTVTDSAGVTATPCCLMEFTERRVASRSAFIGLPSLGVRTSTLRVPLYVSRVYLLGRALDSDADGGSPANRGADRAGRVVAACKEVKS